MNYLSLRHAARGVLGFILAAAVSVTSAQTPQTPPPLTSLTPLPGRETSAASVAAYSLTAPMPVDPEVLVGALPNGLRFYVRPNGKPARRAELRLVVKAGSVLEDDDQRGLAHFVEHMQFEGTRHFPGQGINEFLGALGLSLGADANAATGFDETQYTLRVPTDVPNVLDRALTVLEDWAGGAMFDQAGIDRQRPIVLAEWRMNLGADERTADRIRRVQLEGSRYADRSPIGSPDIIEHVEREALMRFYRDWYRPDLMSVIVVGDVDRAAVARMIAQHFQSLTNPSPERPWVAFDVPEHPATRYAVVTDKETTATAVQISNLRPARSQDTVGGYRDIMLDQLFSAMLGARLDELSQTENPPFLEAAAGRSLFPASRTRDEAALQALVSNDGVTRGLDALVTELRRVVRFGFTATELQRAKQVRMAGYERVVVESPDRESSSRADEYTRNFLQREALPTIWQELAFNRRFLPGITLRDVNARAGDWFPERNRLVLVSAPEVAAVVLPGEAQLAASVRAASEKRLTAYVDAVAGERLLDVAPVPGSIVKTVSHPEAGITEWTLSNGATVVLKPTTLKADQILFRATARGGTSLASDGEFIPAQAADEVIPAGGAGRFSAVALDKVLAAKAVGVRPFISEIDEGMRGGATPQNIDTMFQLLYLRFTQPRADPAAFAAMKAQAQALLANQMASPDVVFNQAVGAALSGGSPRRQPDTPASVERWSLEKSLVFYKARFADASAFTFVFVGSFTPESIKPLVETYVASLPATRAHETWRDLGIAPPKGVVEKTVEKGIAPKSAVAVVFAGPFEYDDANKLALQAVALVLQSRLNDAIREELGGTYSITATQQTAKFPRPEHRVRIEWTCDPARTSSLVQRVMEEVAFIRDTLLSPGQVSRVRSILLQEFEKNSQDNGYLLGQMSRRYDDGDATNVGAAVQAPRVSELSADAIRAAAQKYLDTENYVRVTLMPEAK
jgi:zinc protease